MTQEKPYMSLQINALSRNSFEFLGEVPARTRPIFSLSRLGAKRDGPPGRDRRSPCGSVVG